jgi:hypothetical protein
MNKKVHEPKPLLYRYFDFPVTPVCANQQLFSQEENQKRELSSIPKTLTSEISLIEIPTIK